MDNKQKNNRGYHDFLARLEDFHQQVLRRGTVITPFLSLTEQAILTQYFGKKMHIRFDGGYENSEYKRAMLQQNITEDTIPIICLKATYVEKYVTLTHRDVLGAIMNLGVQRNKVGDIIVFNGIVYLFCTSEIKEFIIDHLNRIKRSTLQFVETKETIEFKPQISYQPKQVSSFRLDVIVSAITNQSREKSKKMILSGLVKVNHLPLEECDYLCNNNCILSIRGYGRFTIIDVGRRTRNHRYWIDIGTYK